MYKIYHLHLVSSLPLEEKHKQLSSGVLRKKCSEYIQRIYRRIATKLYWNFTLARVLLRVFRIPSPLKGCFWKKLLKVLHSYASSEITLSLYIIVILLIFVPLSNKKGFVVFQILYDLLLCLSWSTNNLL